MGGVGQAACAEHDAVDGNLYKLYLELGGNGPLADTGVHLKFPGEDGGESRDGTVDDVPGVEGNPQLPFSKLKSI